ncbi:hypothetical protein [Thiobaca trueperi]|uniref:hypothetical protein n=1 Tax=Thiobaca trueperi TaxID=127458 RepID=UPI0010472588|nr:hypothetical protein [Thiobaca trueperi]
MSGKRLAVTRMDFASYSPPPPEIQPKRGRLPGWIAAAMRADKKGIEGARMHLPDGGMPVQLAQGEPGRA